MSVRRETDSGRSPLSRRRLLEASTLVSVGFVGTGLVGGPAGAAEALEVPAGRIAGIARLGDGLVAIGQSSSGTAAAWVRAASGSWQQVAARFGAGAVPAAVTAYGDGLLAVGALAGRTAAWSSGDGVSWRPILADGPAGLLSGVAASGPDAIAVGHRSDGETAEGAGALVLRSGNGRSWDPVDNVGPPSGSESGLSAVTAYGGRWVAASHTVAGAALWQSVDGVVWSPAAAPAEAGVVISGLTTVSGALVAVGSTIADTQPRLWVRRGGGWSEVRSVRHGAAAAGVLHEAVPLGGSILLVGAREGRSVTVASDEI